MVLFLRAALIAYVLHGLMWLLVVPFGIIGVALGLAALLRKRKVTAEQFADELERHLLGTEGPWDWDETSTVAIADPRLEEVRLRLGRSLDRLAYESDKDELPAFSPQTRQTPLNRPARDYRSWPFGPM